MKKLLVLDWDETLAHADTFLTSYDIDIGYYKLKKRPGLDRFVNFALENFDVAVWSSGTLDYITDATKHVFPENSLEFLWGRERCVLATVIGMYQSRQEYLKPIKKITRRKKYNVKDIIAVDDTPLKWSRSYGNLIRIKEFISDENDNELLKLENYLLKIKDVEDIRILDKKSWFLN